MSDLQSTPYIPPGQRARRRYVANACLPQWSIRFGRDDLPAITREAVDLFVAQAREGSASVGMMFYGSPGRGKTTSAVVALREALMVAPHEWLGRTWDGYPKLPGYFMGYPELLRMHKLSFSDHEDSDAALALLNQIYFGAFDSRQNVRILVLDDVGKEHHSGTGWAASVLHDLLRTRYNRGAPTLVTTNLPPTAWADTYGQAMGSFINEAFWAVNVGGRDRRISA